MSVSLISLIIILLLLYAGNVNEHFTIPTQTPTPIVFTKCAKKKPGTILNGIFKDNNIIRDKDTDNWDLYIPCGYNHVEKELKTIEISNNNQKIFGINGCDAIVSKNKLWELIERKYGRNLARTLMPETFILHKSGDMTLFRKQYRDNNIYILKKNIQNKKGLKLTQDLNEIELARHDKYRVVQNYVKNVFLINKRKINLRIYLLLVCHNNKTSAYLYKEGKCIYTNKDYNPDNIMDKESNITSINLNLDIYNDNPFSFRELNIYLYSRDYDGDLLFDRIRSMILKVYNAVKGDICNLEHLKKNVSFQLFGLDVIFDKKLHPYILEINKGPEMKPKDNRDRLMKTKLNKDMLTIVNVIKTDGSGDTLFEQIS